MESLVEPSSREDGCINYDFHTDREHANVFAFHETWLTPDHISAHERTDHYLNAVKELKVIADLYVKRLKQL